MNTVYTVKTLLETVRQQVKERDGKKMRGKLITHRMQYELVHASICTLLFAGMLMYTYFASTCFGGRAYLHASTCMYLHVHPIK